MAIAFARASGAAAYRDIAGLIQIAGTGVVRDSHYVGAVRTTRLDAAATNTARQSSNWAAPSPDWAQANVTTTAAYAVAPDGTMTANRMVATNLSAHAAYWQMDGGAGIAAGVYTASWWAKNNGGTTQPVYMVYNATASTVLATASYTLTNLWQRFSVTFTVPAGSPLIQVCPIHDTAPAAVDMLGWGAQSEAGATASAYIPTTGAVVTRAADFLDLDFQNTAEAMTILLDLYEVGRSTIADRRYFTIGNSTSAAPYLTAAEKLGALANTMNTKMDRGTGATISADNADVTYAETDHIEARIILNTDGTHGIALTINGGTEGTMRMATSAGALANWSTTTRLFMSNLGSIVGANMSVTGMAAAQGIQTLDTMRYMVQPLYLVNFATIPPPPPSTGLTPAQKRRRRARLARQQQAYK